MKGKRARRRPGAEPSPRAASAAEEAARAAPPQALSDEEKARLAPEASRNEDA
jgi:hypothetical protein